MTDNALFHAGYTTVAVVTNNVSSILAVFLLVCQGVIIIPKAANQIKEWRAHGQKK